MSDRLTVWTSAKTDPIRAAWLAVLVLVDLLYGGLCMFGKAEAAPQILLRTILPLPFWFGLLVVSAGLIWVGHSVWGALIGASGWIALSMASFVTIVHGTALSYGGPVPSAGIAVFHVLIIIQVIRGQDAARQRKMQA